MVNGEQFNIKGIEYLSIGFQWIFVMAGFYDTTQNQNKLSLPLQGSCALLSHFASQWHAFYVHPCSLPL